VRQYYCALPRLGSILVFGSYGQYMDDPSVQPTQQEIDEESRRIRRLRILVHITLETIAGGDLSPEDAAQMIAETRKIALDMFPGKERAFDLIYRPQFQRVMHAVYRLQ
jgi:hypothetical protein